MSYDGRRACRIRVLLNPAVAHADDSIAGRDVRFVVSHDDDRGLLLGADFPQQAEHVGSRLAVEFAGRLIGENQLRLLEQRSRDGDALLLAAGQVVGSMQKSVGQAKASQQLSSLLTKLIRNASRKIRHEHVVNGVQIAQQIEALEDEPHVVAAVSVSLREQHRSELVTVHLDRSAAWQIERTQQVQQAAFPAARWTDDKVERTPSDLARHAPQRVNFGLTSMMHFGDVGELDQVAASGLVSGVDRIVDESSMREFKPAFDRQSGLNDLMLPLERQRRAQIVGRSRSNRSTVVA